MLAMITETLSTLDLDARALVGARLGQLIRSRSVVTTPEQLRALADPLRDTRLELVLERAATITELAKAVDRPKSTIAYHVNLLVDAGLLLVVRTRWVRAIEERYYGRVARTLCIGVLSRPEDKRVTAAINGLAEPAAESGPAQWPTSSGARS